MKVSITIVLFVAMISSCQSKNQEHSNNKNDKNSKEIKANESKNISDEGTSANRYKSVGKLYHKTNNSFIADVLVNEINDTVFTDLIIQRGKDTIYQVKRDSFFSVKGNDINVFSDSFFGYKFLLKDSFHLVLTYLRKEGAVESDNINLIWQNKGSYFGVLKTP